MVSMGETSRWRRVSAYTEMNRASPGPAQTRSPQPVAAAVQLLIGPGSACTVSQDVQYTPPHTDTYTQQPVLHVSICSHKGGQRYFWKCVCTFGWWPTLACFAVLESDFPMTTVSYWSWGFFSREAEVDTMSDKKVGSGMCFLLQVATGTDRSSYQLSRILSVKIPLKCQAF